MRDLLALLWYVSDLIESVKLNKMQNSWSIFWSFPFVLLSILKFTKIIKFSYLSEALLKQYDSLPSSKEYPQHAASSLLEIGVSIFFFLL